MYSHIKFSLVFLICCSLSTVLFSQKDWRDGFYISNDNDTIEGKVLKRKNQSTWQMDFLTVEGKKRLFEVKDIQGYCYDQTCYDRCETLRGSFFMRRIVTGPINLYQYHSDRYIQKGSYEAEKLDYFKEWEIIKGYIIENDSLLALIENSNRDTLNIVDQIEAYNQWLITNNIEYHPSENIVLLPDNYRRIDSSKLEQLKIQGLHDQDLFNLRVILIAPAVGLEVKMANAISLYAESGMGFKLEIPGSFEIYPYLQLQPRFYTNLGKRYVEGKRVAHFSGDYFGPMFRYIYPISDFSSNYGHWYQFGLCYGFQRNKVGVFYYGFEFGLGILSYRESLIDYRSEAISIERYIMPQFLYEFNVGINL